MTVTSTVTSSATSDRTQAATISLGAVSRGLASRRGISLGLIAVAMSVALAACGSSPATRTAPATPATGTASVISAPVRIADTRLSAVGYRVFGSGPPLVLIMGYAGTMQDWDPRFVDALARHYRVVIFDNAGIGRTAALSTPLSIDAMADQTSALISTLGLGRPDVLGWSMGGMIAQALAVRHPAQVRRLVLCATFPGTGTAAVPSQAAVRALTSSNPQQVMADLFPPDQAIAWDAFTAGISSYPYQPTAPVAAIAAQARASAAWFAGADPAGRRTAQISVPTLIADGSADRVDPVANDHALARLIPGAKLVLYPDAGHAFLFQEGTPLTFLIGSFLTGAPTPLSTSGMRTQFLAGDAQMTTAGKAWASNLKALHPGTTLAQITPIDQSFAAALGTFDSQLLGFGATGTAAATIITFVHADENIINDVLALTVQTRTTAATYKTTFTKDGKTSLKALAGLRKALGLPPVH